MTKPNPNDPDTGEPIRDPYHQGWLASMLGYKASDNSHPPGEAHERWALGFRHGLEEDADNAANARQW